MFFVFVCFFQKLRMFCVVLSFQMVFHMYVQQKIKQFNKTENEEIKQKERNIEEGL